MSYWAVTYSRLPFLGMVILSFLVLAIVTVWLVDRLDKRYDVSVIRAEPLAVAVFAGLCVASIIIGLALVCQTALTVLLL